MEIILLERVENLGGIGDVVKVRAGFARNYLLPNRKALRATDANKKVFEAQRADIEARNAEARAAAGKNSEVIDGKSYVLIRQAGESGQLYGSVSARDIADAIAADAPKGFDLARSAVVLDKPIKTIGVHQVRVRLHAEVSANVSINVARSTDEAERQARGEDVVASALEEQRAQTDAQAQELAAASIANEPSPRDE
ncbi:MAG: 50S ribosomal protein L9 [Alphaproteobacteria bacterium]|nr:50S ribosomal protein L9 [Alphaproteobacteria bacterium]